ncbi:hypothetical protein Scep_007553 [Stephania cephalantha]|uniref:Uncharacterized protein n=1 Tax=Stephania cephalantha TaxID=152367 RepID=A0AAP0PQ59_9MAGN
MEESKEVQGCEPINGDCERDFWIFGKRSPSKKLYSNLSRRMKLLIAFEAARDLRALYLSHSDLVSRLRRQEISFDRDEELNDSDEVLGYDEREEASARRAQRRPSARRSESARRRQRRQRRPSARSRVE